MTHERDNIRAMHGYTWGEQPEQEDIIKLNTNENPYPPSPAVDQALAGLRGEALRTYPQPTADRLREHMPAAWADVARRTADPELRGEFVFITGPSRTADIEKILILGAHGPKRLIILLVG